MLHLGGWDVHTHIVPPAVVAAGECGKFGMRALPGTLMICAHGVPLHPSSEVNRLADRIKSDDLDGAIVSVPPPLFRPDLAAKDCRDYTHLVNDGLYEACRSHDRTLRPLAYLPVEAPEVAATVARSLDARWAGVVMGTETGGLSYASAELDPLWEILSDKKLSLFIHPGSTPDKRLDPFYLTNLLRNPVETTIAAANLIFAGVVHRFPGLKVILAHGGGCVAALCGRWQRGAVTNRPGIPKLTLEPKDAVRRFMSTASFIRRRFSIPLSKPLETTASCSAATGRFQWARPAPITTSVISTRRYAGVYVNPMLNRRLAIV